MQQQCSNNEECPDYVGGDDNVNTARVFRQPSYRDNPLQLGDHQLRARKPPDHKMETLHLIIVKTSLRCLMMPSGEPAKRPIMDY